MHQGSSHLLSCLGQQGRCQVIQPVAQLRVLLRLIHSRIGCTVHHYIYFLTFQTRLHRLCITDIQFLHIGKDPAVMGILGSNLPHLSAQLAVGSSY